MHLLPQYLYPAGISGFVAVYWLASFRKRSLKSPEAIFSALDQSENEGMESYVAEDGFQIIPCDQKFYLAFKQWRGFVSRRRKAGLFVQFCQQLDTSDANIEYLTTRSMLISFFCCCALFEAGARIFAGDLPHVCAQIVFQLYWEMERRFTLLCSELRPDLLDNLHKML